MTKKYYTNNTNILPEKEFNFIVSDVRIPRMVPLQTLADESGISYKALWQMCKQNKIVHIKSGNKFLVNVDKFVEYLNAGELEVENDDKIETRGRKLKDTA
ncbi:hypothetical protein HMPREF9623_00473 [Stomatobaculum longum]|uniref:Excisionase family DNA binding domain-containing protein n=1 Tax=Stomatobaculum longum TaxID=796942 RepID=A0AA37DGV8_9FIRM|nr:hypothetical protein [Stomatobaculum longum]EHO17619.1 hypothetical protein HMPREF9623_00473 [Stomatobaculum longum]